MALYHLGKISCHNTNTNFNSMHKLKALKIATFVNHNNMIRIQARAWDDEKQQILE